MSHETHDWANDEALASRRKHGRSSSDTSQSAHAAYLQQLEYPVARHTRGVVQAAAERPTRSRGAAQVASAPYNQVSSLRWSQFTAWLFGLLFATLLSAMVLVYSKDLSRRLFIQYGSMRQVQQSLRLNWGRLLLENATLSTPARIQQIATAQLGMVVPPINTVKMLVMPGSVQPVSDVEQMASNTNGLRVKPDAIASGKLKANG